MVLFAAIIVLLTNDLASARQVDGDAKATVELLLPRAALKPGETVAVGVKFTMQPGWHIYWTNPGDSGQPPTFRWSLPGGGASRMLRGAEWEATDPSFPTPQQFVDGSGAVGYGYSGTVIFPATITVPASTVPGQGAELAMAVDYLVCDDICLAESAVVMVNVEVGVDVGEDEAQAVKAIEAAEASVPVAVDKAREVKEVKVEAVDGSSDRRRVTVEMAGDVKNIEFFPNPPANLSVENIETDVDGSRTTFNFLLRPLAGAQVTVTSFPAVIGYTTADGSRRGVEISIPVAPAAEK